MPMPPPKVPMNGFGLFVKRCQFLPPTVSHRLHSGKLLNPLWRSLPPAVQQQYQEEAHTYFKSGIQQKKRMDMMISLQRAKVALHRGQLTIRLPMKELVQYEADAASVAEEKSEVVDEDVLMEEIASRLPPITARMVVELENEKKENKKNIQQRQQKSKQQPQSAAGNTKSTRVDDDDDDDDEEEEPHKSSEKGKRDDSTIDDDDDEDASASAATLRAPAPAATITIITPSSAKTAPASSRRNKKAATQ